MLLLAMGSGAAKGKGSKGKGKGSGSWVFVPVQKPTFSKGGKKAGKKGGKGHGKGKKGKKPKTPFAELSDERKEEIRARHEAVQAEQGREVADDTLYFGEVLQRGKKYGWIKPSAFGKLQSDVQAKGKEMCKAKKKIVRESESDNQVFNQNVLFLHMSDVEEGVRVGIGDKVKFKVYTDNEGAGACEVEAA